MSLVRPFFLHSQHSLGVTHLSKKKVMAAINGAPVPHVDGNLKEKLLYIIVFLSAV